MIAQPILTNQEIDDILTKYMIHVCNCAGITFIDDDFKSDIFSDTQWNYLKNLDIIVYRKL